MIGFLNGRSPGKGVVSAVAIRQALTDVPPMEAAKIVELFMEIRENAARADEQRRELNERLGHMEAQLSQIVRDKLESDRRDSEFERRLKAIEARGFLAWSESSVVKRIVAVTGLILGIGGAFALIAMLFKWFAAHVHF